MGAKSKVKRREKGEVRLELPPPFEAELSSFLAWVQLEKGLAKNTVHSYENDLIQCAQHLHRQGVPGWQVVELVHLSKWLASLSEDEYAVASLARKLSAVRMLAKYLVGEGLMKEDFTELLPNPKKKKTFTGLFNNRGNGTLSFGSRFDSPFGKARSGFI
jgi:integrase/recombinase XerD